MRSSERIVGRSRQLTNVRARMVGRPVVGPYTHEMELPMTRLPFPRVCTTLALFATTVMALGNGALSAQEPAASGPVVISPVKHDTSPPLRDIVAPAPSKVRDLRPEHKVPPGLNQVPEGWSGTIGKRHSPHVVQSSHPSRRAMPSPADEYRGPR